MTCWGGLLLNTKCTQTKEAATLRERPLPALFKTHTSQRQQNGNKVVPLLVGGITSIHWEMRRDC